MLWLDLHSALIRFRFVHRTCDPEADSFTYQKKNEMLPDYQYVCLTCKNMNQFGRITVKRKDSKCYTGNYFFQCYLEN